MTLNCLSDVSRDSGQSRATVGDQYSHLTTPRVIRPVSRRMSVRYGAHHRRNSVQAGESRRSGGHAKCVGWDRPSDHQDRLAESFRNQMNRVKM